MILDALEAPAWRAALGDVLDDPALADLDAFLAAERAAGHAVLPPQTAIFALFDLLPPEAVRVVLLGQDPYPTPGHAHGLAFSYRGEGTLPRSLANIKREVEADLGVALPPAAGDLTPWVAQGVFLFNPVLTVRAGAAGAHRGRGWEVFSDAVIDVLSRRRQPVVWLLWGGEAKKRRRRIAAHHPVLEAGHPSPLSIRHFRGCRHFSRANALLPPPAIDWTAMA